MKYFQYILFIALLMSLFAMESCKKMLDEPVYSQLAPGNFLTTRDGIESVLNAAFSEAYFSGGFEHGVRNFGNQCTDIEWETGGGENRGAVQMINFTWDASLAEFEVYWEREYRAIRNANEVLDHVGNVTSMTDQEKTLCSAEARFVRALSYAHLYDWFGPVPLRSSEADTLELSRATKDEVQSFIASELLAIIPELPDPGKEANYGRPNKGAAMALLCKFYLNTKQWQKCADMAQKIIGLNDYKLYPEYADLFKVENERNKEFILVDPQIPNGSGNWYINGAFPPGFYKDPVSGLTMQSNWNNWAAQYRLYDAFYNSFGPGDKRKSLIISRYINKAGDTVSLLNSNDTRSFKYWPDPNAISNNHGNDVPEIRFADILLSRAEALNEIEGPNQESIDLINEVRERAGLSDLLLSDFTSKDMLRNHLLKERGWEFYNERAIRRQDQIRMGTFISSAIARGHANAKPYMVLFPIPQQSMDSNPKLVQNSGY
ncbi:MAG TPA: RagB/SusD family nutrient uptake outer membrane protein [Chitinophagaceae bacterium]|nr:RagB/SusD family nutrient uptake outer membrane protein [Chitinophagaceae bacterium]